MKKLAYENDPDEITREFEGGPVVGRWRRRPKSRVLITLRVHPDVKKALCAMAKDHGLHGHTTMARVLIEDAIENPPRRKVVAGEFAKAVVDEIERRKVAG